MSLVLPELRLPQRDELKAASVQFLGNVKDRFGQHSVQLSDVHKTLDLFSKRALSKKETHKAILDTLEGHNDLRQEMMDVLMHPAARWAPDDFDLPTQPLYTTPQFLQPAHEPQMRLPTLSSWFPLPQQDQSTSFTMFDGYDGFSGQQSLASSPSLLVPRPAHHPDPPAYPWTDENSETIYAGTHDDRVVPLPVQTAFRNPWQEGSNYADAWTNDDTGFPPGIANVGAQFELREASAPPLNDDLRVSSIYPQYTGPYATPTLLQQETPQSLSAPQHTYDVTPSPVEKVFFYAAKPEEQQPADLRAPPIPSSQSPPSAPQTTNTAVEAEESSLEDHNQSTGELFIHVLCRKGFATLAGVKKHHWGKRVNDPATTTGCWAKHKKPDITWDDHPSCKERRPTSIVIKSMPPSSKQSQTKVSVSHFKSPSAVSVSEFHSISGFPTLEDLPHTVARTVNAGSAAESSTQKPDVGHYTHRPASRSRFDSLLTAVNAVSQIDAPKPKRRTESIALQLDAQVATAEQHDPFVPYQPSTGIFTRPHHRPIAPAALNTIAGNGMEHRLPETSHTPVNYESEEQIMVPPSDVDEAYGAAAISQPFEPFLALSSGPVRKKRKL